MSEKARLPDPVYKRAKEQAEDTDSTIGEVVRRWMRDAHEYRNRGSDVL